MRRAVILGQNPYISESYRKGASTLFEDTGGNSGNLAFLHAVASHLGENASLLNLGASAAEIRRAGDIVVLPLANQLGAHTDLGDLAAQLEEIALPVIG